MSYAQANPAAAAAPSNPGLYLYLLFMTSWFLHLPARLSFLGAIRFDLLLVCLLTAIAFAKPGRRAGPPGEADMALRVIIAYAILTIPLVYWPGSVIKLGLPNFVKAVVFFYFTIVFVRTEADLRKLVFVFVSLQIVRVLEPLYLNVTQGYWGSRASMANWESLERLSGAPSDVINSNGLAFLVCTILPFLYFMAGRSFKARFAALLVAILCVYALALTGSRSGIIGLAVVMLGIVAKSRSPASFFMLGVFGLAAGGVGFMFLNPDLQDRYLSIVGLGEKNLGTFEDRMEGMTTQLEVLMHRPIFGHGLGTSAEANANFTLEGPYAGRDMPAHNLYLEIGQELGVIGIIIFLFFIKAIFSGFAQSRRACMHHRVTGEYLPKLIDAMQVWLWMNLVFSFASYGLSSYEWYLFGGLSVVLQRLAGVKTAGDRPEANESSTGPEWLGSADDSMRRRGS
jgi:putative inorganic carbon (HCO3(-)) transporter